MDRRDGRNHPPLHETNFVTASVVIDSESESVRCRLCWWGVDIVRRGIWRCPHCYRALRCAAKFDRLCHDLLTAPL